MDHTTAPVFNDKPPTSSSDPRQQAYPKAHSSGSTKEITAHDTVPTGTDGIEGTKPDVTDGPKAPDPSSGSGAAGTGTEYNTHTKATGAPGSQSELFGLTPKEGKVHPPPGAGSGPKSGNIGTSGHQEM